MKAILNFIKLVFNRKDTIQLGKIDYKTGKVKW